jgi:LemA protein
VIDLAYGELLIPGIVLALIIVIAVYLVSIFNRLLRLQNAADANLSQIEVAMKKRLDMIDQLLGAVKGYVRYEKDVFKTVTELRSRITRGGAGELEDVDRQSRSIFSAITAIAEDYPDLKADQTVQRLMDAIISVEDEIARHRYTYNNIVQEFNTMRDTIPSSFIASAIGTEDLTYLEFEEEVEKAPIIEGISENE